MVYSFMIIFFFSIMNSSNHPMIILLLIILISILISFQIFNLSSNQWMSIFIMLLFIGGMMILFLFLISMTPNQTNKISKWSILIIFIPLFFKYSMMNFNTEKTMSNFMSYSFEYLLILSILFFMILLIISKILYNPNQTMKKIF